VENLTALDVADGKVIAVNLGSYRPFLFRRRVRKPFEKVMKFVDIFAGIPARRQSHPIVINT
jgi:hypothetical protein